MFTTAVVATIAVEVNICCVCNGKGVSSKFGETLGRLGCVDVPEVIVLFTFVFAFELISCALGYDDSSRGVLSEVDQRLGVLRPVHMDMFVLVSCVEKLR